MNSDPSPGYRANGTPFGMREFSPQDQHWHQVFQAVGGRDMFTSEMVARASRPGFPTRGVVELTADGLAYLRESGWNPMNTNLGLGASSAWGDWEMVRDLVQNALDETEDFLLFPDAHSNLWIEDEGSGVTPASFMMGTEALQKGPEARGRFGTGMKISVLAALRNGQAISFATSDGFMGFAFMSGFTWLGVVHEPTLWIAAKRAENGAITFSDFLESRYKSEAVVPLPPVSGTRWMIRGYTGLLYKDRFATTIRPVIEVDAPDGRRQDAILKGDSNFLPGGDRSPPGWIYGRDIWMRETDYPTPVSYNLWGFAMAHDRHAEAIPGAVEQAAAALWAGVWDRSAIAWLFRQIFAERRDDGDGFERLPLNWEQTLRFNGYANGDRISDILQEVAGRWREVFSDLYGPEAVIYTEEISVGVLEHYGLKPVKLEMSLIGSRVIVREALDRDDVKRLEDKGFRLEDEAEHNEVEEEELRVDQIKIIRAIKWLNTAMIRSPFTSALPDVKVTRLAQDFGGLYVADLGPGGTIYIDLDNLETLRDAIDVYIHEFAHYWTKAPDLSEEHVKGISFIGEYLAWLFASGRAPEEFYIYAAGLTWRKFTFKPLEREPEGRPGPGTGRWDPNARRWVNG